VKSVGNDRKAAREDGHTLGLERIELHARRIAGANQATAQPGQAGRRDPAGGEPVLLENLGECRRRIREVRRGSVAGLDNITKVITGLREYAKMGVDHVNAIFPYTRERELVELLGREVVAALA